MRFWMSGACIAPFCKISLALALLGAVAERADAQTSREVQLLVTAESSGESTAPVRLRLRSGNPELLEQAARARHSDGGLDGSLDGSGGDGASLQNPAVTRTP
jgi:hypothetical protein